MADQGAKLLKDKWKPPGEYFCTLPFSYLEGKPLVFTTPMRPFKRILCFHACLVWIKAKKEHWPDFEKPDYWNEGFDSQKITGWIDNAVINAESEDEDKSEEEDQSEDEEMLNGSAFIPNVSSTHLSVNKVRKGKNHLKIIRKKKN
jgi:hypothetical protein